MEVHGVSIPYKPLTNFELYDYAENLNLNLRGIFMRNNFPTRPYKNECEIVNFNKVSESGTHWVSYY